MSDRTLVINGLTYLRSRNAARLANLAPDYVSRLARVKMIDGWLVDNVWFVNVSSLQEFMARHERQKEMWRAELARKRRDEQIAAGHPSALCA